MATRNTSRKRSKLNEGADKGQNPHSYIADGVGNSGSEQVGAQKGLSYPGRRNLFVDDGSVDGTGQGENPGVSFPDSTIETADRSLLLWARGALKGDSENLQSLRVLFATGERWALMKQEQKFVTQDGVPILPLVAIVRNSIVAGKEVQRKTYNSTDRMMLVHREEVNVEGKRGVRYFEIAPPIPFEVSYTLEFWTRTPIELNEVLMQFLESMRDRQNLEVRVADPVTGWTFDVRFEGSFAIGENIDDFTGAQRIVRSSVDATLWGRHIRGKTARSRTYSSFPVISFDPDNFSLEGSCSSETADELREQRADSAPQGPTRASSPLPHPSPQSIYERRLKGVVEPVRGNSGGSYRERRAIQLIDRGRRGERVFRLDE